MRCWFGEWSGGSSTGFGLPKCVGNPCELPEITGGEGKYIGSGGSYRPGMHYTKILQADESVIAAFLWLQFVFISWQHWHKASLKM